MQYFGFDRPSFGVKTYGFGVSNSKLIADFTTGTYKASGAAKTFADLFAFTRAGKAWLVKETGLQEYAADVPRLDNGLLIEQSATNYCAPMEFGFSGSGAVEPTINNTGDPFTTTAKRHSEYRINSSPSSALPAGAYTFSVYVASSNVGARTDLYINENMPYTPALWRSGRLVREVGTTTGGSFVPHITRGSVGDVYRMIQVENSAKESSYIKVASSPVTRPADFLTSKITGTTVTGDWDSTLSLSIVAGELVHSGYGRIRSLEVN